MKEEFIVYKYCLFMSVKVEIFVFVFKFVFTSLSKLRGPWAKIHEVTILKNNKQLGKIHKNDIINF